MTRRSSSLALLALLASCQADVRGSALAINDPLDLIDDVQGPLRLFVLEADAFACDATTGQVAPEVPDVAEGMFLDAVADLSLTVSGSRAMQEVEVPAGDYVVLVRGKGTDPVSMRPDVFIATGCASVAGLESGQTRAVPITLLPLVGSGVCGDGTPSPDEQCEDGNTTDGDGCSATCRVEPFTVNTTTAAVQNNPQVGSAPGQRFYVGYDSDNATSILRVLEADGSTVTNPSALSTDADIDAALADISNGAQLQSALAVHTDGRVAWAFADFNGGPSDIRVAFTSRDRNPEGPTALVVDGVASEPRVAFAGNGAAMVVYQDMGSATGLSAQVFAPAAATPSGTPMPVGAGAGNAAPAIAGTGTGFVVAYAGGGGVFAQRFGADGAVVDATPLAVSSGAAAQDQPTVAAMSDGSFLVAWRDAAIDGAGTGIAYRRYGADGAPSGEAAAANTTTAGDQSAPAAAANADAYVIAFASGGGVRASVFDPNGNRRPNREAPPTAADFALSASGAEPAVAAGGDGAFLAVWAEGGDIRGALHPLP